MDVLIIVICDECHNGRSKGASMDLGYELDSDFSGVYVQGLGFPFLGVYLYDTIQ